MNKRTFIKTLLGTIAGLWAGKKAVEATPVYTWESPTYYFPESVRKLAISSQGAGKSQSVAKFVAGMDPAYGEPKIVQSTEFYNQIGTDENVERLENLKKLLEAKKTWIDAIPRGPYHG